MTLSELKELLAGEKVYQYDYSINKAPMIDTVVCVNEENGFYHVYISDKRNKYYEHYIHTEHAACIWVLDMLSGDYPFLKKYIK